MMITKEKQKKQLNKNDRCDACNAQAFVIVKMLSGELMFCGHHYKKYQSKLDNQSYEIIDERDDLTN